MNAERLVFTHVIDLLDRKEFQRRVALRPMQRASKAVPARDQFLAMAFAQITFRESLRDIEACLRNCPHRYAMGGRGNVTRTNLADANEFRDWRIYEALAQMLIRKARRLYAGDSDEMVYAVDASTIDLCLSMFPWAHFRRTMAAIKLHAQIELFFKWIKLNLRIKAFHGTSVNIVRSRVWIAICVYLLIACLNKVHVIDESLRRILQIAFNRFHNPPSMTTNQTYPKVVYCSHHKCATKWFLNFFRFGSRRMGWRLANIHKDEALGGSARDFCQAHKVDMLFLSNAKYSSVENLDVPVAHVVRDPRDMLVSGFFSHRDSHETENWPELAEYRRKIKACPEEEGLRLELDFSSQFLNNLEKWPLSGENLMTMRYEDFCRYPFEFVYQLVSFFDIVGDNGGVGRRFISRLMEVECKVRERLGIGRGILKKRDKLYGGEWLLHAFDMRFEKLKRGAVRQGGPKGHYRQGGHGQWKGLFGPDMTQAFDQRYGHLVKHYGYSGDDRDKQGGEPA